MNIHDAAGAVMHGDGDPRHQPELTAKLSCSTKSARGCVSCDRRRRVFDEGAGLPV